MSGGVGAGVTVGQSGANGEVEGHVGWTAGALREPNRRVLRGLAGDERRRGAGGHGERGERAERRGEEEAVGEHVVWW